MPTPNGWNKYPNTDFHELKADWILKKIKNLEERVAALEAQNEDEEVDENGLE